MTEHPSRRRHTPQSPRDFTYERLATELERIRDVNSILFTNTDLSILREATRRLRLWQTEGET